MKVIVLRVNDHLIQDLSLMVHVPNPFILFHPPALKGYEGTVVGGAYVQQFLTYIQFDWNHITLLKLANVLC